MLALREAARCSRPVPGYAVISALLESRRPTSGTAIHAGGPRETSSVD